MSDIIKLPTDLSPPLALDVIAESSLDGEGTLTGQVYRLLRSLIVDLRLLPNQFLSEKDVSEALSISKTPVREAFIRLSEDGMVMIVSKSGTYVAPIDIARVTEGYFVWSALESACVAEVAVKRTLEDVYYLRGQLLEQKEAVSRSDFLKFYELDNIFHAAIFRIGGYQSVQRLVDAARLEVDRMLSLRLRFRLRPEPGIFVEHETVVDAIAKRNAEGARLSMIRHLLRIKESLEGLMDSEELWNFFHQSNQNQPRRRGPRQVRRKKE